MPFARGETTLTHSSVTCRPCLSRCHFRTIDPATAHTMPTGTGPDHDKIQSFSATLHPGLDHPVRLTPPPGVQPVPVRPSSGQVRTLRPLHRPQQRHPSTRRGTSSNHQVLVRLEDGRLVVEADQVRARRQDRPGAPGQSTLTRQAACRAPRTARAASAPRPACDGSSPPDACGCRTGTG